MDAVERANLRLSDENEQLKARLEMAEKQQSGDHTLLSRVQQQSMAIQKDVSAELLSRLDNIKTDVAKFEEIYKTL